MLPRIISAVGAAISPEEIAAVQRVTSTKISFNIGIHRVIDELTGVLVEHHPYNNTVYTTPGGATDYVVMDMPNPVPYRGVSIGVVTNPIVQSVTYVDTSPIISDGLTSFQRDATTRLSVDGIVRETYTGTFVLRNYNFNGFLAQEWIWTTYPSGAVTFFGQPAVPSPVPDGMMVNGAANFGSGGAPVSDTTTVTAISGYGVASEAVGGGSKTYVMTSDGTVLASEVRTDDGVHRLYEAGGFAVMGGSVGYPDINRWFLYDDPFNAYRFQTGLFGGALTGTLDKPTQLTGAIFPIWMFHYSRTDTTVVFDHKLNVTLPDDCISPDPEIAPPLYPGKDGLDAQWEADWATGVAEFNTRRINWFKKNSDEFIAALKTGFAADAIGVTRAELKTGNIPTAWQFIIKRDIDLKYDSYPPTNTIGRKTQRAIRYSEILFSETVESDTSAGLTQAGVKVTKRAVTLSYSITVNDVLEVRLLELTGFLTQTVTRHNNSAGSQLALSRRDVYDTWYNRESTTLPTGVPSTITAPYLKDRTTSRIGVVLNGAVQGGYNADSEFGVIGNPLTYALYIPAFPKTSSTVVATTPDYIATWHKDAKITYNKDSIGASNTLNDSALFGVTLIEITPVSLPSFGIFPDSSQDGTTVEIFGTATYLFDWQSGTLTFSKWNPLHDENGFEVSSKAVVLPAGTAWSDFGNNCLITYSLLKWPDVVAAIKVRDKGLPTATSDSDKILYELIKAVKAG